MRKVQERNCADLMKSLLRYALLALVLGAASCPALAAKWQYQTAFETGTKQADGKAETGTAFVWLPPASKTLRGLLIGGKIGIELELALDPEIRKACADNDIGIIYFLPHISKLFHYWEEGATDAARLLKTIDGIAELTGHPEIKRVPWITMGHSTGGMFCRNVAYWQPARVGGIIHVRSGNLFQTVHYPPSGSLAGVPFLAVNGQFETHGPRGGNRPELGRETLIYFNREDMQKLQQLDPNHLAALLVEPGGDHFHDSVETSACIALFIRKIAHYRLPGTLPPGGGTVKVMPIKREDGWLSDADLYDRKHTTAPFADYTGDKAKAWWHFDGEIAKAGDALQRNAGNYQALSSPTVTWLDEGDGWTFRVKSEFLDRMPSIYGGKVGDKVVGHATTPIFYRCLAADGISRVGPDTFRVLRPTKPAFIVAVNEGDEHFQRTSRTTNLTIPQASGTEQAIEFPAPANMRVGGEPQPLTARATSKLPVYYEVDYGPVEVKDGTLVLSELPVGAKLPIECKVTAYQQGRRIGNMISPATAVSRTFEVIAGD